MKYLLVVALLIGGYFLFLNKQPAPAAFSGKKHEQLIMYSLTTCGYCKQKAKALEAAGIPYQEYFIDVDQNRREELDKKLTLSGLPAKGYGTPIFDAYGYILPNNPSISTLQSYQNDG